MTDLVDDTLSERRALEKFTIHRLEIRVTSDRDHGDLVSALAERPGLFERTWIAAKWAGRKDENLRSNEHDARNAA